MPWRQAAGGLRERRALALRLGSSINLSGEFMFKRTKVSAAAALVLGGLGAITVQPAIAQETQRIEITGSAIRRIAAEGALPVQVLKQEDIARSGATSVTDLLQRLPALQGGFGEASAVGSGAAFNGASIHNIGDTRTLVLLNGRRLAMYGGQSLTGFGAGIDLNSIPASAIERIEVLTDGASALYGADAIAGVVNFITKRDFQGGDVTLGYSAPKGGAREKRVSGTVGFGSLAVDGFNAMLTLSHDERTKLDAKDRGFGSTGKVFFDYNGRKYRKQQFSASPIPANVLADPRNPLRPDDQELVSPYLLANGRCPDKTFRVTEPYESDEGFQYVDDYCGFDFVGELEIFPVRERDSAMFSLNKRIGSHEFFAEGTYSKSGLISRIAPVPGSISIDAGTALHDQYLVPVGITQDTLAFYRLYDLGKRTNDETNKFTDIAVGAKGAFAGIDYNASLSHSKSDSKTSIGGYPGSLAVGRLTAGGSLDPFVGPGQQSAAGQAAINSASFKGYWDGGVSTLDSVQVRGTTEFGSLAGGPMALAVGVNYGREKFQSKPSLFAQGKLADPVAGTLCDPLAPEGDPLQCDQRFGDESATVAYSANRKTAGVFSEIALPVSKALEFTGSVRFDKYSDFGNATTAKASFKFQPTRELLFRGSVGTGFHAPTVPQVNAVLQPFGVTNDKYLCTPELQAVATSLGANCQTGNRQYDQLAGGNPNLEPEKSKQASLGMRFEPSTAFSAGVDLWHVNIDNAFGQLSEEEVFGNPGAYLDSWGTKRDTGTGVTYLAFKADNRNLGRSYTTGLDFDILGRGKVDGFGDVTSQLAWTYIVREVSQLTKTGPFYSAVGNFAELGSVTFRWKGKWTNTVKTGSWAHTVALNFQAGYKDRLTTAERLDSAGNVVAVDRIRLDVPSHLTFDWQTVWSFNKHLQFTVGALNITNETPPLAISTGGNNRGQQFGFDDRYYDSRGRTWYANASYRF
jgi:iron complex outermembrane recepter protein